MRIVKLTKESKNNILEGMLKRSPNNYGSYESVVADILANIKENGDKALFEYTKKFDKFDLNKDNIRVTEEEIKDAYSKVSEDLLTVIKKSLVNVKSYHEKQRQNSWFNSTEDGTILGQKVTPLERVGVYVPGGKAVYPSSVLMNIVPAKVAGVKEIIMTTPCNSEGEVNPAVLVAANEAGVDEVYKVGGAQAIGALAYGTESIRKQFMDLFILIVLQVLQKSLLLPMKLQTQDLLQPIYLVRLNMMNLHQQFLLQPVRNLQRKFLLKLISLLQFFQEKKLSQSHLITLVIS